MSCTIENNTNKNGVLKFTKMGVEHILKDGTEANHRFRAWIVNHFIELSVCPVHRYSRASALKRWGIGNEYLNIDSLFHKKYEKTNHDPLKFHREGDELRSSKEAILNFVNRVLDTSYIDIEFIDTFKMGEK